jgi:hypothetical protein
MLLRVALLWAIFCQIATALAHLSSHASPGGVHCDMLDYLSRKPYVQRREDLLLGAASEKLRLFLAGVSEDDIRPEFQCHCKRADFDPDRKQIHRSVVNSLWHCGPEIEIAVIATEEFEWGPPQWEEFAARVSGKVPWDHLLEPTGWLWQQLGWHYSSSWISSRSSASSAPFALLTGPLLNIRHAERMLAFSSSVHVRHLTWSPSAGCETKGGTETNALALKTALVSNALEMQTMRAREALRQAEAEHQRRIQAVMEQNEENLKSSKLGMEMVEKQLQTTLRLLEVQRPSDTIQQNLSSSESSIMQLRQNLQRILTCPLTRELLVEPLLNTKSGRTYSGSAVRQWIQTHQLDPITRQYAALDDLIPNLLATELLELLRQNTQ